MRGGIVTVIFSCTLFWDILSTMDPIEGIIDYITSDMDSQNK